MGAGVVAKAAAAGVLLLACGSCSYVRTVNAAFVGGRLAFVVGKAPPRESPWCLATFEVGNQLGEIVWAIERSADAEPDRCAGFPLLYGRPIPGMSEIVPARPLLPRELYVISAQGGDGYEGAFVLFRAGHRLSVENVDWDSPAARASRQAIGRQRSPAG